MQNGAFFMELDAANTLGQIEKGINPDIIGSISPSRKFALVYKGEIVAQGSRYDKAYQKTLMDLKGASYDVEKVENILKELPREKIYIKYADKFELKFHHHFDGEILIKQKGGEEVLELFGAHNHEINGIKIQVGAIRKPLGFKSVHELPNDVPFKANVNIKYNNGIIKKTNTSSFFPINWDIKKVKQEIALVYDEMLKSGRSFPYENNKFFFLDSTKSFEIQIEFDKFGNLTSAYPKI